MQWDCCQFRFFWSISVRKIQFVHFELGCALFPVTTFHCFPYSIVLIDWGSFTCWDAYSVRYEATKRIIEVICSIIQRNCFHILLLTVMLPELKIILRGTCNLLTWWKLHKKQRTHTVSFGITAEFDDVIENQMRWMPMSLRYMFVPIYCILR